MKKIIFLLILCTFIFCSCTGSVERTPTDILSLMLRGYSDMPHSLLVYFDGADIGSENHLSQKLFSKIYFSSAENGERYYSMAEKYAVLMGRDMNIFEIHIIKVRHLSDAQEIMRIFGYRKDILRRSSLSGTDKKNRQISDAVSIFSKGKYVYMIATYDNSIAEDAIP